MDNLGSKLKKDEAKSTAKLNRDYQKAISKTLSSFKFVEKQLNHIVSSKIEVSEKIEPREAYLRKLLPNHIYYFTIEVTR